MTGLGHFVALTAPLFLLVLFGYALTTFGRWPPVATDALTRFVFTVAMPALLFRLMSDFSRLPRVDARILIAYFGGCLVVYAAGRFVAATVFRLDGVSQSVFGMGGIFSNNVLLGLPIAQVTLGDAAMPGVSLILVFNSLILWTLVTVSVEWARHRELSVHGFAKTVRGVVANPIIGSILLGTAWGFTGIALPTVVDRTIELVAQAGLPLSLVVLGMGLAQFGVRAGWRISGTLAVLKLAAQPAAVYAIALLLGLSTLDVAVVVLMAALPIGANVYLMARQFDVLSGPVASGIVLTTVLGAVSTPFVLALTGAPIR